MDYRVTHLVRHVENKDATTFTHTILGANPRQFSIKLHCVADWWETYCDPTINTPETVLLIAENPTKEAPLWFNCRFIFKDNDSGIKDELFVESLVQCFQQSIVANLDVATDIHTTCIVLMSESWTEGADTKQTMITDMRFSFPKCRIDISLFESKLRPLAIDIIREKNVLATLTQQPIGDWESIINKTMNTPLPLYGSRHRADEKPVLFYGIYDYIDDETDDECELDLSDVFDVKDHIHYQRNEMRPDLFQKRAELRLWLPYLLSIYYGSAVTFPRNGKTALPPIIDGGVGGGDYDTPDKKIASELIRLVKRGNDYSSWLAIGKAYSNIYRGRADGLIEWIRFTLNASTTFKAVNCKKIYNELSMYYCDDIDIGETDKNYMSVKTIAWFAMKDDPEGYNEWHKSMYMDYMMTAVDEPSHVNVGRLFYQIYWLQFVCASIDKNWWYVYNTEIHKWVKTEGGHLLLEKMSDEFIRRLQIHRTALSQNAQTTNNRSEKALDEIKIKNVTKLIHDMGNVNYQRNIVSAARIFFYDASFLDRIDTLRIVGTDNGVIELTPEAAVFREGYPEDFITFSTYIPYRKDFSFNHPIVKQFMKWLQQAHPNIDCRMFFRKHLASFLRRGNADKHFMVWSGEKGNNSKTAFQNTVQAALGRYCVSFPLHVIMTKKFVGSGPTPELAQAKNVLVAFITEPDESTKLSASEVKAKTGNEPFFARGNHQDGGRQEASFKMILVANKVPNIPNGDKATKNRLINTPFNSEWSLDAPDDEGEQYAQRNFKMDTRFDRKTSRLALAMLWLMVQDYSLYVKEGLKVPDIIKSETEKYWDENDLYFIFIKENVRPVYKPNTTVPEDSVFLSINDLYGRFKVWHEGNYPGQRPIPDRGTVEHKMKMKMKGEMISGVGWKGWRLETQEHHQTGMMPLI